MDAELGWTVHGLLDQIIASEPHFNALIDTGALITGMTNLQVAEYIAHKSSWCDGVVFLDSRDEKRIYVKATRRVVKLAQCGIKKEKRFAFYDQIHTTGMDIQHISTAKAVLTLGKDMVFRDFAQGAFRMRGIGKGQQVTVLVIPEVQELMKRQLGKLPAAAGALALQKSSVAVGDVGVAQQQQQQQQRLKDISAWLVLNAMRSERVQFDQLCTQNMCNVWRKNAWDDLLSGHAHFKVKPEESGSYVLELLGEAFVSAKGNVSRATAIDDKYVAILMSGPNPPELTDAIKVALETLDDLSVVWVSDSTLDSQTSARQREGAFAAFLQQAPVLAVPSSHTQRIAKILKFFGRVPGESQKPMLVLVDRDGRTITRHGSLLFCVSEARRRLENQLDDADTPYAAEQKQLRELERRLRRDSVSLQAQQSMVKIEAQRLACLQPADISEIEKFLGKVPLPAATGMHAKRAL